MNVHDLLLPSDTFAKRHLGVDASQAKSMLATLGLDSMDALIAQSVPKQVRFDRPLNVGPALSESEALAQLQGIADQNDVKRSLIGLGYHDTLTPAVIQRNILENPGWYTQYTPYQAEISQGRLEALLNYQTMVSDLTGLPLSNSSLLDEATAAAEAMTMSYAAGRRKKTVFAVSADVLPQTLAVLQTRAEPIGIELIIGDLETMELPEGALCGALIQYPGANGHVGKPRAAVERIHAAGGLAVVAADILSLCLLASPGELGADIAVGSTQRFGVPMGFGGPHAGYIACNSNFARQMPGRIIGVSKDRHGAQAYRLALQTREQHIRRDKATSNICTAQVLLAIIASMYAVYHGPAGLRQIAERVRLLTGALSAGLQGAGISLVGRSLFDTLCVEVENADALLERALEADINLRKVDDTHVALSLDEKSDMGEVSDLLALFGVVDADVIALAESVGELPSELTRQAELLGHEVFNTHHAEHEMLRYLHRLQAKDLSLTTSMIPLGSCTMKLNATSEMLPITWPEFAGMHPFAPQEQTAGYRELFRTLEAWLADITGFAAVSLQPNAGSQGEYAGLLTIRAWHRHRGDEGRNVCLIPLSAHGTNPASAAMVGMKVVAVKCDLQGNIDLEDLKAKAEKHSEKLAALMITYPSTHGVFEEHIREVCKTVHDFGGLVYMDGANMNAQVGITSPGELGADVCHLNLHKTFCIPHGGGGPGVGPIGVNEKLAPFLPGHPVVETGGEHAISAVSAAPWGSASILPISWMYIRMMGDEGLRQATEIAVLNANYMAERLKEHWDLLYVGNEGRVAHEFILDLRPYKASAGVEPDDVAKRLMDFGFHAPTMSWPVPGTLMVEPTESEPREELDRFCDAMIQIREEIRRIESGEWERGDNPLHNAPHTAAEASATEWNHGYTREQAVYPLPWVRERKFWPSVGRVDNAWGDRNLMCTCPTVADLAVES